MVQRVLAIDFSGSTSFGPSTNDAATTKLSRPSRPRGCIPSTHSIWRYSIDDCSRTTIRSAQSTHGLRSHHDPTQHRLHLYATQYRPLAGARSRERVGRSRRNSRSRIASMERIGRATAPRDIFASAGAGGSCRCAGYWSAKRSTAAVDVAREREWIGERFGRVLHEDGRKDDRDELLGGGRGGDTERFHSDHRSSARGGSSDDSAHRITGIGRGRTHPTDEFAAISVRLARMAVSSIFLVEASRSGPDRQRASRSTRTRRGRRGR